MRQNSLRLIAILVALWALGSGCGESATFQSEVRAPGATAPMEASLDAYPSPTTAPDGTQAIKVPKSPEPPPQVIPALPSISSLVDRVRPSVASISVESVSRGRFFDFTDEGAGSGIVVRPKRNPDTEGR